MTDFIDWIHKELEQRNWSYAELARRAGLSSPTISLVISGQNKPGLRFCKGMARAFRVPVCMVLREAGLVPSEGGDDDPRVEELIYQMAYLSEDQQDMLMTLVRTLAAERIRQIRVDVSVPVNTHPDTDND